MTEALTSEAQRETFLNALKKMRRSKLTLEEIRPLFLDAVVAAQRDADFGRNRMLHALETMQADGLVVLPAKSMSTWVIEGKALLPGWIRVVSTKAKAPRVDAEWDPRVAPMVQRSSHERVLRLKKIDDYLKRTAGEQIAPIPVNCRSLHIFGDEKLLLPLADRETGRISATLSLADLHCYVPEENLLVHDLCPDSRTCHLLVIENLQSYHVFRKRNDTNREFRAVVYGGGKAFANSTGALEELATKLGADKVYYFGDLDVPGFEIPMNAIRAAERRRRDLRIVPHSGLYLECLQRGVPQKTDYENRYDPVTVWTRQVEAFTKAWLADDELFERIAGLFAEGKRLAQEWVS